MRARLLPQDVLEGDQTIRKIKEILQAKALTDAFPGDDGKQRIITAYLNQIYYGHQAYGVAAAAQVYFGITDLKLLTPGTGRAAGRPAPGARHVRPLQMGQPDRRKPDPRRRLVVPTRRSTAMRRCRHRASAATSS